MKVTVAYPVPFDNWRTFRPGVERFVDRFKKFPPTTEYTLMAVANWGMPTDEIRSWFYDINTNWIAYYGHKCDLGSWMHVAMGGLADEFIICCTSMVYFHRAGWLERLVAARIKYGPGLYSTSASHECGQLHACNRCFGIDAQLLASYPHKFTDRNVKLEVGKESLNQHVLDHGGTIRVVMWDGIYQTEQVFKVDNRFRDGNQQQVLVWDRHTDNYVNANAVEKERLKRLADGPYYRE